MKNKKIGDRILQFLISLFTRGGKTKNGSIIVKDFAYATKLKTISNWQYTDPGLYKTWQVFPKKQQISYLQQIKQGKMTPEQLEKQIQAYEDMIAPAKINFTVKHGIKFAENELLAINTTTERLANMINNKENLAKYPEGFNMILPTEFTVRSPTVGLKNLYGKDGLPNVIGSSKMKFPEGEAYRQAKVTVHVVPYDHAKKLFPGIKKTWKGFTPGDAHSTEFYLIWDHYTQVNSGTWAAQLADIKNTMTHEIAHIKDPSRVAAPKLRAKYDANAPYVADINVALSKKAAPNWKKNYYYHQWEVAANLAPVLEKITSNTKNILRHAGKKKTLAALDTLSKWAASGTNVTFKTWSAIPGNFTNKLDTTATYILTGNHFDLGNSVEAFFHEFKIENPAEHRKVLNKLARQIESLKQQVKDTKNLTPESIIKLKTLI